MRNKNLNSNKIIRGFYYGNILNYKAYHSKKHYNYWYCVNIVIYKQNDNI